MIHLKSDTLKVSGAIYTESGELYFGHDIPLSSLDTVFLSGKEREKLSGKEGNSVKGKWGRERVEVENPFSSLFPFTWSVFKTVLFFIEKLDPEAIPNVFIRKQMANHSDQLIDRLQSKQINQ